jgi:hypothetical protein
MIFLKNTAAFYTRVFLDQAAADAGQGSITKDGVSLHAKVSSSIVNVVSSKETGHQKRVKSTTCYFAILLSLACEAHRKTASHLCANQSVKGMLFQALDILDQSSTILIIKQVWLLSRICLAIIVFINSTTIIRFIARLSPEILFRGCRIRQVKTMGRLILLIWSQKL